MVWLLANLQMSFLTASLLPKLTSLFIMNMPSIWLSQDICTHCLLYLECSFFTELHESLTYWFIYLLPGFHTWMQVLLEQDCFPLLFAVLCLVLTIVLSWESIKGRKAEEQELSKERLIKETKQRRRKGRRGEKRTRKKENTLVENFPLGIQGTTGQICAPGNYKSRPKHPRQLNCRSGWTGSTCQSKQRWLN